MRLAIPSSLVLIVHAAAIASAGPAIHHAISLDLAPASHQVVVRTQSTLPAGVQTGAEFLLSSALRITAATPAVEEVPLGDTRPFFGNNGTSGALDPARVKRYRFETPPHDGRVSLSYEGTVNIPLSAAREEYTRGFRETAGLVGPDGVYLAGSTFWYPHFGDALVTFELDAAAPEGWHLVSQGKGTSRDGQGRARWAADGPMDEIYLVGGPLRVWRDSAGSVETLVYLRQDDPALASRYLAATAQYLDMYRGLIGPYPYAKFALVENFWETGYGMPSFTLLGPSVIRFPWILTSSYPHEILHNWWGNGVFVDYASGNWSEGLTAYLADHLIQEQRGKADEYRRATLQKYRNYVGASRDFALTEFRSRESAATEAVGYGKTLMGIHMLRQRLGDDGFRTLLARLYREYRGTRASFSDLRRLAESIAAAPLEPFFRDWIERPGAAELRVSVSGVRRDGDAHVIEGTLSQAQEDEPFDLAVPIVVQTTKAPARTTVRLAGRSASFSVRALDMPLAVVVDPQFDVMRRLDPRETPPSIGQIFGEAKALAVLPSRAPADLQAAYRELAKSWQSDAHELEIALDTAVAGLPRDRAVWLFGRENRFAPIVFRDDARVQVAGDAVTLDGERIPALDHSVVVTARHPEDPSKAVGWIVVEPRAAFPGVSRKLPHYGRYSYLGFEGAEPTNTVKGEWSGRDSPLRVDLRPDAARGTRLPALALPAPKPLADLPPAFSQKSLMEHVAWLAAPEREGRGAGTAGLDTARDYLSDQFARAGLSPAGENGTWLQRFTIERGPGGSPVLTANVVGVIAGTNPALTDKPVLVTAHFDHLGSGWPEAREGEQGKLHPGADDNASGVAVLIELARVIAASEKPQRPIVFVAFSGEEAGLLGAKHYVAQPTPFIIGNVMGVVNLDTVGRLGKGKVSILGAGTATEWPHIFRGGSFVTGVESAIVPGNYEASDQRVFIERGIPAIQVFTGPHADYHRPGDTADKVDGPGLVKVAALVREAVVYLAGRAEPLTNTTSAPARGASAARPAPAGGARRVTFGAVPDFAFEGQGVRLTGVSPGSPAEKAGMQAGDVIVRVADRPVGSLREFSEVLRTLAPGQSVPVVFTRGGQERSATVSVIER